MTKQLRKFSSKNTELDRLYQNVASFATQLVNAPIIDGLLLTNVALTSGDNTVSHKLGRKWRGWILVDKQAAADVYATASKQTNKDRTITLTASANVTVSLYVF